MGYASGLGIAALAAVGYTFASFSLKAALGRGASSGQVNCAANLAMALLAQPLWLLHPIHEALPQLAAPLACAATFFCGQVLTFAALASGDVSVATPMLGTKIIWVTVMNAVLFGLPIPGRWWVAALAGSLAVAVIAGAGPRREIRRAFLPAALALGAAACFSLADVMVQNWTRDIRPTSFLAAMFGAVGILSSAWYAATDRKAFAPAPGILPGLCGGAALLAIQSGMVFLALAWTRDATATNIVYSSRSLLSVAGAWALGHLFGLREAGAPRSLLAARLAGAALLFAAILLIVRK